MSAVDIVVLLVLAGILSLAVWKIRKDRKSGAVCSGCGSCPMAGDCSGSKER